MLHYKSKTLCLTFEKGIQMLKVLKSEFVCEEIISGAQRIDMPGFLVERAQAGGIDVKKISLNLSGIVTLIFLV
ncbi:hypothetical protein WN943_028146 [Citrus x changshan-huyou]